MTLLSTGCPQRYRNDLDYSYAVEQTWSREDDLFGAITQFQGVAYEPDRLESLKKQICDDTIAANRKVLEIGTGVGHIATLCLLNDAASVVATDRQPAAVSNAHYNVAALAPEFKLDGRLRPESQQDAFSAIETGEQFDLILVDLDRQSKSEQQDLNEFIETLVTGLKTHLNMGGRCLIQCSQRDAIEHLRAVCAKESCRCKTSDQRDVKTLPSMFFPAINWELTVPQSKQDLSEPNTKTQSR